MTIRMRHAESGGTYDAQPSQVPLLELSGWQAVEGEDLSQVEPLPPELQPFGGQATVQLHHPDLGVTITVAESAVPFHRERGWLLVEEGEAEPDEPKPVRRRRGQQPGPEPAGGEGAE